MDQLATFDRIADHFRSVVASVPDDRWSTPTNCEPWDARTLASHAMASEDLWRGVLIGEQLVELSDLNAPPAIDGSVFDYVDEKLRLAAEAWRLDGVLEKVHETPLGPQPGSVLITFPMTDLLCHAWDLGSSVGVSAELPDDLHGPATEIIEGVVNDGTRALGLFGAAADCPGDATVTEKLLAHAGRPIPR